MSGYISPLPTRLHTVNRDKCSFIVVFFSVNDGLNCHFLF